MEALSEAPCVWMCIFEERVFRFDASPEAREAAWPSISFMHPKQRDTPLENVSEEPSGVPQYLPHCTCHQEMQIMTIQLPKGTSFYGTGEVGGPLERTGQRVHTWNTDAWGYGSTTTPLYQSHPWVLAVLPDGQALGVLADTTRKCEVDLQKESLIHFAAEAPYPLIMFGPFPSPATVMATFSRAIGTISMPPKWSLGYHQCRYSYEPDSRVLEVAETLRERQIPCDVLWMDIDYMDEFRCFTFHPENFSSPKNLAKELHSKGFKAVWMIDPGIKAEPGYSVYDSGCSQNVWILSSSTEAYVGHVWPGLCVFPDYTSSETRKWWSDLVSKFVLNGVDGIWNDMNEPAVFKTLTKTMPETNIHRGDAELGGSQAHSHYHNVYGMLMARSTYEGMLLADPKRRPFVLTRAGFVGSQRYAATWTGDNTSSWEHLCISVPMALNLGLSGQPFSGPDIGGFIGDATPKLFARWMGIGAMFPFSRGHSEKGTTDHEPWSFGAECEKVCRLALERRYRILPHLYTLFYNAHTKGELVMSPLFFAGPADTKLRKVDDSFLLGPMLVSLSKDKDRGSNTKTTILPTGIWIEFDFDDSHEDLPSLYLKGGSIIPTGPVVCNTDEMLISNELSLLVALDDKGQAEGLLYEDEGDGFEYQRGKYLLTSYKASLHGDEVRVRVHQKNGQLRRPKRALSVHLLLGDRAKVVLSGVDGEELKFKLPKPSDIQNLVAEGQKKRNSAISEEIAKFSNGINGAETPRTMVTLKAFDWKVEVAPWNGGRLKSMIHLPTGIDWLCSKGDLPGYVESSGTEYQSPGCFEEYHVLKNGDAQESLVMTGDIGGGLELQRSLALLGGSQNSIHISSCIRANSNMIGSGGFSRVVFLRVHPTFHIRHPDKTFVSFIAVNGNPQSIHRRPEELLLHGDELPNGEWMLVDKHTNIALVNKFRLEDVKGCLISWRDETCTLELHTSQRPVSKTSLLSIHHIYESINIGSDDYMTQ
ncbi:hypothetical protein GOP47_0001779 [Adiantum capillus-veneris]|uniref:Alpha-glucosidase n=1 Tax=Adiantum capillus-veneris TaxID=13818 RepID=A0A9D4V8W8_ADICA|nr:hypothetical protein GOP47_0001779 [Adiantum capillus-veneris]